jgi:hypothetical protein
MVYWDVFMFALDGLVEALWFVLLLPFLWLFFAICASYI